MSTKISVTQEEYNQLATLLSKKQLNKKYQVIAETKQQTEVMDLVSSVELETKTKHNLEIVNMPNYDNGNPRIRGLFGVPRFFRWNIIWAFALRFYQKIVITALVLLAVVSLFNYGMNEYKSLNSKIEGLQYQLASLKQSEANKQSKIEDLNQQLTSKEKIIEDTEYKLSTAKYEISTKESKLQDLKTSKDRVESDKQRLAEEVSKAQLARTKAVNESNTTTKNAIIMLEIADAKSCMFSNSYRDTYGSYSCTFGGNIANCTSGYISHSCFYKSSTYTCERTSTSISNCRFF